MKRDRQIVVSTMATGVLGAAMAAAGVWLLRTAIVWTETATLFHTGPIRGVDKFDAILLSVGSVLLTIIGLVIVAKSAADA